MIFGNWRPGGLAAGAGLFGYTDALQLRRGGESVHALLLLVGRAADRGRHLAARCGKQLLAAVICAVVGAAGAGLVPRRPTRCPATSPRMTPYLTTLLVLALASQRLRMPAADGLPYRRGQGG